MKIVPTEGLSECPGNIRFGMTEAEVTAVLGKPEQRYTDEDGDISVSYASRGIDLFFYEEEDYTLSWIDVEKSARATLWDYPVFDMDDVGIVKLFQDKGHLLTEETEDEIPGEHIFYNDELSMDLYFDEDGKLNSITMTPFIDDM